MRLFLKCRHLLETFFVTYVMTTRILTEQNLNLVLNENTRLEPSQFEAIKNKMRQLDNDELKQFAILINPVVKYLAKSILFERGIK